MFNQAEYEAYCNALNLSANARQQITRIRSTRPFRRVKSGPRNVSCRIASRKMGVVIQAESHRNELGAIMSWEYDNRTFEFYDQSCQIKLNYQDPVTRRNRGHLTTPDFFVLQQDFVGWVECKTEEWLKNACQETPHLFVRDKDGTWRCPPGEAYANTLGLQFRVRSSAENNWTAIRNAEFLSDYLDEKTPLATQAQLDRVGAILKENAWIRLKTLLEADEALPADIIYSMIAQGQLHVDLAADLLAETERTIVFRDALAAKAYRLNLTTCREAMRPALRPVKLKPGQTLVWDKVLWRVLNVGESEVFLEDENHTFAPLPYKTLTQLVKEGAISGLPEDTASQWALVDQAVHSSSPEDFEVALQRYYSIFPQPGNGQPPLGGQRVQRKWRRLYRMSAEATGYGFIGLLPKIHLRGNRDRKLSPAVIALMNQVIDNYFANSTNQTILSCYGEVRLACKEQGLILPSENAFRKEMKRRRGYDLKVQREGYKAAYTEEPFIWYLERTAPRHGERPFELAHIDHTQLDLQFVSRRTGEHLDKAWLTVMIDAYTRMILAWWISFEEPSYRSCMGVLRECIKHHGRLPRTIVVDKGAEFNGTYFETLLAHFSTHKKTRPGSKPRYGSLIERLFGMTNTAFIHNLVGNNKALQKPRSLSPSHDPRALAVWNLQDFSDAFDGFLEKVYHAAEHSSLGMSPQQMMDTGLARTGYRHHTLIPFTPELNVWFLPGTPKGTAKLAPSRGVKINYLYYWCEDFRNPSFAKKDLPVRFDPDDISTAYVWLSHHWVRCRSELAADFEGYSEKEINLATKELRARNSKTGQRRALTAELIAAHLRSTSATEKLLATRKKHQESFVEPDETPVMAPDIPADLVPLPAHGWGHQPTETFGEFQ